MRSKIHTCQPQTVTLIAPFWLDDVSRFGAEIEGAYYDYQLSKARLSLVTKF